MRSIAPAWLWRAAVIVGLMVWPTAAFAQDSVLNGADTAWILTSTALVLFMTLPGLALFYGGLVQQKNLLSVMIHCFAIACLASVLWYAFVYGLAFGDGGGLNDWIGGTAKAFMAGVSVESLSGTIPEPLFFMFQMTFAIITPALMVGAFVERIKFSAVIIFCGFWLVLVYAPIAHWIWGGGWLAQLGIMDFAGGLVVHTTAGVSALILAILLGSRTGFPRDVRPPHSPGLTMMGAAMLWVGWFGFNAGSAVAADSSAAMAMTVTHISAAVASLVWMAIEWLKFGKPSIVGMVTGMVAGLASITPASGFVGPLGGLAIGLAGGLLCFWFVSLIKKSMGVDDSLDVFAVHGVGGILGTLLAAVFAAPSLQGLGYADGMTMMSQLVVQLKGVAAVAIWSAVISLVLLLIIRAVIGLRVSADEEIEGLDLTTHGERAYTL